MFLHTLPYYISLPFLVLLYYQVPFKARPFLLLAVSMCWIGCYSIPSLLAAIVFSGINYYAGGLLAEKRISEKMRLLVYRVVQSANIAGLLFLAKISADVAMGITGSGMVTGIITILGISYYTLQNIGYLTDVHRGRTPAALKFSDYLLYNIFFPRFTMGPFQRYADFSAQLQTISSISYHQANMMAGGSRILLGIFKKTVLADRLYPITKDILDGSNPTTAWYTWVGAIAFFVQLYLDFSGFMDIALGSARMLGVQLKENFQLPMRAASITAFWRKWHISLMDWLATYVYYPVTYQFRRTPKTAGFLAILATFLVSGFWHGRAFTYLTHAMIHMTVFQVEFFTRKKRKKIFSTLPPFLVKAMGVAVVWVVSSLSLVFFRAENMEEGFRVMARLFDVSNLFNPAISWKTWVLNGGANIEETFNIRVSLLLAALFLWVEPKLKVYYEERKESMAFVFVMALLIVLFGVYGNVQQFYYLQF